MIDYRICSNCKRCFNTQKQGIRLITKGLNGDERFTYYCKKSCMRGKYD